MKEFILSLLVLKCQQEDCVCKRKLLGKIVQDLKSNSQNVSVFYMFKIYQ